MDQAAGDVVALDPLHGERDDIRVVGGSVKVQGPVRPSGVVVVGVLGEYLSQVPLVAVGRRSVHSARTVRMNLSAWAFTRSV